MRLLAVLIAFAPLAAFAVETNPPGAPVLIELFTSQGCSSCPPADALLSRMDQFGFSDALVIPLAYHVDYWDNLGWKDPFSHPDWTNRQIAYGRLFKAQDVYTPQLVVNGARQCLANDPPAVRQTIRAALAEPAAARPVIESITLDADRVYARVSLDWLDGAKPEQPALFSVLYENGLSTEMPGGENAGKTLRNDAVVRRASKEPVASQVAGLVVNVSFPVEAGWKRENMGFAVFAQSMTGGRVYGAAKKALPSDLN